MLAKNLSTLRKTAHSGSPKPAKSLSIPTAQTLPQRCHSRRGIAQKESFIQEGTAIMKRIAAALIGITFVAGALLVSVPVRGASDDDMAALYNTKCKMCHGATAEKKLDKTKADDALIQIVLDGKAADKPPNMPAFKEKGITPDQAKALVGYMKSLK